MQSGRVPDLGGCEAPENSSNAEHGTLTHETASMTEKTSKPSSIDRGVRESRKFWTKCKTYGEHTRGRRVE